MYPATARPILALLLATVPSLSGCIFGASAKPVRVGTPPPGRVAILPVNRRDMAEAQLTFATGSANKAAARLCRRTPFLVSPQQFTGDLTALGHGPLLTAYATNRDVATDADLFRRVSEAAAAAGYDTLLRVTVKGREDATNSSDQMGAGTSFSGHVEVTISEYRAGRTTPLRTEHGAGAYEWGVGIAFYIPLAVGSGPSRGIGTAMRQAITRLYGPPPAEVHADAGR